MNSTRKEILGAIGSAEQERPKEDPEVFRNPRDSCAGLKSSAASAWIREKNPHYGWLETIASCTTSVSIGVLRAVEKACTGLHSIWGFI